MDPCCRSAQGSPDTILGSSIESRCLFFRSSRMLQFGCEVWGIECEVNGDLELFTVEDAG
jgi:hypothetical protein